MNQPPCAYWNIWLGPEVEGQDETALGKQTLFVRRGDPMPYLVPTSSRRIPSIQRVWFCKEFTDWLVVQDVANFFPVCLEITQWTWPTIPNAVRESDKITLFLKVAIALRQGDHVCVGPAFHDESFIVGKEKGAVVSVQDYLKDRRLE